jgi:hypothetical protein
LTGCLFVLPTATKGAFRRRNATPPTPKPAITRRNHTQRRISGPSSQPHRTVSLKESQNQPPAVRLCPKRNTHPSGTRRTRTQDIQKQPGVRQHTTHASSRTHGIRPSTRSESFKRTVNELCILMTRLTLGDPVPKKQRLTTAGERSGRTDPARDITYMKAERAAHSLEHLDTRLASAADELVERMSRLSLSDPKVEELSTTEVWWEENAFILEEDTPGDFGSCSTFLDLWPNKGPEKRSTPCILASEYHTVFPSPCSSASSVETNETPVSPPDDLSNLEVKSPPNLSTPLPQSHSLVWAKSIPAWIGTVGIRSSWRSSTLRLSSPLILMFLILDMSRGSVLPTPWDVD